MSSWDGFKCDWTIYNFFSRAFASRLYRPLKHLHILLSSPSFYPSGNISWLTIIFLAPQWCPQATDEGCQKRTLSCTDPSFGLLGIHVKPDPLLCVSWKAFPLFPWWSCYKPEPASQSVLSYPLGIKYLLLGGSCWWTNYIHAKLKWKEWAWDGSNANWIQ